MAKNITIKLTGGSIKIGPFIITNQNGNVIAEGVTKNQLIAGIVYSVADDTSSITLQSLGNCRNKRTFVVGTQNATAIANASFKPANSACIWTHLKDVKNYNFFYGIIEPYIIEYPFNYNFQDQILQNVKDHTKAYIYDLNSDGAFDETDRIEADNRWFNKAVLYNNQQSTGILRLVPKPKNNLHEYLKYPKYDIDSKTILFTKSDSFYQYNAIWNIVKDKTKPLFIKSCESMSIDKVVNQSNMNYNNISFKKDLLRSKDLKIRHILDNRKDTHLVSQFILSPTQLSYK